VRVRFGRYGVAFYTNFLVARKHGGSTYGPFAFIRPVHVRDEGLFQHEMVHTRQFWRYLGLQSLFTTQLQRELEAYKVQMGLYAEDKAPLFAYYLAHNYEKINITEQEALELLRRK